MSSTRPIRFSITIHAPIHTVWRLMIAPDSYRQWTTAFSEGSHYEGSWDTGAKIRFLGPSGDGMVAEIAQNRMHAFISIRHLGLITSGVEDTTSASVRAWAPIHENYTFTELPGGMQLLVEMDVPADWEPHMNEAWPKALRLLRQMSESERGG